jgi:very-short-patch-repair endonuclease/uncharacterized C2H2 Zn-finger protein
MKDKKGREVVEFIECPKCERKFKAKHSLLKHLKYKHDLLTEKLEQIRNELKLITTKSVVLARRKAIKTMREDIDENGLDGCQRIGLKSTKTLREDVDENGYNGIQRRNNKGRSTRINTLNENGVKISIAAANKRIKKLREDIDENGLDGCQRIGKRTRETLKGKIDDKGRDGYQQIRAKQVLTMSNNVDNNNVNDLQKVSRKIAKKLKEINPDHFKEIGRKTTIRNIEKYGDKICPNHGKFEDEILDEIERIYDITIVRQYRVKGYFLDGYCVKTNTAYEINEAYHYMNEEQMERDNHREQVIKQELGCVFIIIKEKDYLLNKVFTLSNL